ncbi:MAG: TRAP transporter small permease [Hoeflea sp.]|uniref:TRAP transporter small permease n=1 Tax=Hoeflea sp. TaxID=1940281 RepID=UPI003EF2BCEF
MARQAEAEPSFRPHHFRRLTRKQVIDINVIDNIQTQEPSGRRAVRFFNTLWRFIDILMALTLVMMIALVFANVVLRYGFQSGLRPSVELSRLGLVWLVMLGAAVVLRRNEHLAVAEFSEALFPRAVPILRRLSYAIILFSVLMLFWGAFNQMNANWNNISQLTGLPSALFYLAGVVSSIAMAVIALVRIFNPDALGVSKDEVHPL